MRCLIRIAVCVSLLGTILSTLHIYPHSLAYFNELAGGPEQGYRHLLHSNIDWGQDLLYLKEWLREHPDVRPLHLAYYGAFDPADIGINDAQRITTTAAGSDDQVVHRNGCTAVSLNLLAGYHWTSRDGRGVMLAIDPKTLKGLDPDKPFARCGYSILVFIPDEKQ